MASDQEKNFRILIADENIQFRNTLASKLRIEGFPVEFSNGGFHLLHILERHWNFNLVIFHEDMSDMPAFEIISLIRESKPKAELPILFISQKTDEEEICEMIFNGANEYVVQSSNFQPIVDHARKYFTLLKNS